MVFSKASEQAARRVLLSPRRSPASPFLSLSRPRSAFPAAHSNRYTNQQTPRPSLAATPEPAPSELEEGKGTTSEGSFSSPYDGLGLQAVADALAKTKERLPSNVPPKAPTTPQPILTERRQGKTSLSARPPSPAAAASPILQSSQPSPAPVSTTVPPPSSATPPPSQSSSPNAPPPPPSTTASYPSPSSSQSNPPANTANPYLAPVTPSPSSSNAPITTDTSSQSRTSSAPPLARALGVENQPTAEKEQGWFATFIGPERTGDKKKDQKAKNALAYNMTVGRVSTMSLARTADSPRGKFWTAPKLMIREDKAKYFPDIAGKPLRGLEGWNGDNVHTSNLCKGKISVISFVGTETMTRHTKSFISPLLPLLLPSPTSPEALTGIDPHPLFNLVSINHQPSKLRSFLVSFFINNLRSLVPIEQQSGYLLSSHSLKVNREDEVLGMENEMVGYVYLVDENLKIRWAGCGNATPEEQKSLVVNTQLLLDRLEKRLGAKPASRGKDGDLEK